MIKEGKNVASNSGKRQTTPQSNAVTSPYERDCYPTRPLSLIWVHEDLGYSHPLNETGFTCYPSKMTIIDLFSSEA